MFGWQKSFEIPANSSTYFSLKAMDFSYLSYTLYRSISKIKALTIKNDSDSTLLVGPSGTPSGVNFLGQISIGPSGIHSSQTYGGIDIPNTNCHINLINKSLEPINCRVIVVGIQ